MAGRSGIGVLVTGFSRVGALKKHAPLVFILKYVSNSLPYIVHRLVQGGLFNPPQGDVVMYEYKGVAFPKDHIKSEDLLILETSWKARPDDIFVVSCAKAGNSMLPILTKTCNNFFFVNMYCLFTLVHPFRAFSSTLSKILCHLKKLKQKHLRIV